MKQKIKAGTTSYICVVRIRDTSVTTGWAGLTGLAYNSASLTCYYIRRGDALATAVTLANATVGTYTSGGFKEISSTNMPGFYELHIPNAVLASGSTGAVLCLKGATNMEPIGIEIELDLIDYQDNVRAGLTALPNAAAAASGGLPTIGTSTGQITLSSGAVTVGTNNDKTGYSLSQAFPSNFSSLAITVGGAVTAGTVSDKTGYSLTQTFPSNFSSLAITGAGAVTAGTVSDKTGYSLSQSFPTNFASLAITGAGAVTAGTVGTGAITTGSFAAGAINAAALATDCITSDQFATSAVNEIAAAVSGGGSDPWSTALPGAYASGTAGYIVGNNLNATVSSRMATFTLPTNFSSLAITGGGAVTAGTVSDKTGYSLATAPPTASAIATAVLTTAMTESYAADGVAPTLTQAVLLTMQGLLQQSISGTTVTIKKLDKSTTAATYTLDSATTPTSRTRAS